MTVADDTDLPMTTVTAEVAKTYSARVAGEADVETRETGGRSVV